MGFPTPGPIGTVAILYTNWKGEVAWRYIVPKHLDWGHNEWHAEDQWLLIAFDLDKRADRTFAMKDIHVWRPVRRDPPLDDNSKESD